MSKPKSKLSKQYETALLGEPEVKETITKTTSRTVKVPSKVQTTAAAEEAPITRLASPKTVKTAKAASAPKTTKTVTTTITTEVKSPKTSVGVKEHLEELGYLPKASFT